MKQTIIKQILTFALVVAAFIAAGIDLPAATTYEVVSSRIVVRHAGGMPALCWAANGDLLLAHATNWQPIPPAGGTVKLLRSSDGGKTWSQPEILVRPKDPEKWSVHIWSGLHRMPDDSLILAHGQNRAEEAAHAYVIRSNDHGKTWGDPVRLAGQRVSWDGKDVVVPYSEGFGHPVTAHNGDVLVPIGVRREDGFYGTKASAFVRTRDGGKTWGPLEFIATGEKKFSETSMGIAANGHIVAVIRCDTTRRVLWQSVSHDNGRTWSAPERTKALGHVRDYIMGKMPDMLALPSERLLLAVGAVGISDGSLAYRGRPGASYCGLFISDDVGRTWRQDVLFPSADADHLIPYDSPVLARAPNGDILALSVQMDRRSKGDPRAGWTMGSHYVLHVIREVK